MKITEQYIKSIKWDGKDKRIVIGDGLTLQIRKKSLTWIIRRMKNGKTTVTTIGKHPAMSLKEAKAEAAKKALEESASGMKVSRLIEKYMKEVIYDHRRPDFVQGYFDRAIIPEIGNRKVSDITRGELVTIIQNYRTKAAKSNRGDGARSADQLRSNLKKLFSYSVELGIRDANPMNDVTRRIAGYKPKATERVLTDEEIRAMWSWKNPKQGWQKTEQNLRVAKFLLLTGLRISEAQKGYQDGDKWIVPQAISKNKKPHWVFLTETAKAQLPLPKCTSTNIQAWLRRKLDAEEIERFTPHDLRRTAATRMADNGIEPFIVERVLNHTLEGVMAVYNRAEYESERIEAAKVLEKVILEIINTDTDT